MSDRKLPARLLQASPGKDWRKRFVATEPRLSEAVRAYRDLGFEVVLLPAKLADLEGQHCTECLADAYGIYTRPARRSQGDQGETS